VEILLNLVLYAAVLAIAFMFYKVWERDKGKLIEKMPLEIYAVVLEVRWDDSGQGRRAQEIEPGQRLDFTMPKGRSVTTVHLGKVTHIWPGIIETLISGRVYKGKFFPEGFVDDIAVGLRGQMFTSGTKPLSRENISARVIEIRLAGQLTEIKRSAYL